MTDHYQLMRVDGTTGWRSGSKKFDAMWDNARDRLRFHRGERFTIRRRPDGTADEFTLGHLGAELQKRLNHHDADTVYVIRSVKDGFGLLFRRHDVPDPEADQLVAVMRSVIGTRYVFGVTDCSWLTQYGVHRVEPGLLLPHNATMQMKDDRVIHIQRSQLKKGDLLFHWGSAADVDHVSTYLDDGGPGGNGRVIDTEPHDTNAPSGWPTGTLGTGVRIRPMNPGYYCDWAHVVAIGRIPAINGKP